MLVARKNADLAIGKPDDVLCRRDGHARTGIGTEAAAIGAALGGALGRGFGIRPQGGAAVVARRVGTRRLVGRSSMKESIAGRGAAGTRTRKTGEGARKRHG